LPSCHSLLADLVRDLALVDGEVAEHGPGLQRDQRLPQLFGVEAIGLPDCIY
jgi:hypothetical protein